MIFQGDCISEMQMWLPDRSVHMCVTSPPYFGLRDYGVKGQLGLEATPEAYVAKLVEVFREVRRVLRDDGTLWLVIGDSYAGSWGAQSRDGKHAPNVSAISANQVKAAAIRESGTGSLGRTPGLKNKDLIGIPWRVAFALQADGWYLRQDIVWNKPNPMPESTTDRCTKAHEYVFLLTKSRRYYFDNEAIKEPSADPIGSAKRYESAFGGKKSRAIVGESGIDTRTRPEGMRKFDGTRNKRSVWTINTQSFRGAHFATFPTALVEPCILAGTSAHGHCAKCGAGWMKGVATCKCDISEVVPGVVLDPFGGSGTTALVARQHGRRSVLFEMNADYVKLAEARLAA